MKPNHLLALTSRSLLAGALTLAGSQAFAYYPSDSLPAAAAIGAYPAPPTGAGNGRLVVWHSKGNDITDGSFGTPGTASGNSFYLAVDQHNRDLYIPTAAGKTFVLHENSLRPVGHIPTIDGGRVARVTPDGKLLLVLSGKQLAAYSTRDWKPMFHLAVGGNALAISLGGRHAFIGGNRDQVVTQISLPSGAVERTFDVGNTGDLAWANGKIFAANMKTGVMSVIHPRSGKIVRIQTSEVDPSFSYRHIPKATAGFMQLAVSPDQRVVYAAGFSGHILLFSTDHDRYLGEIPVHAEAKGPNKLSGLTVVDGGAEALVTVENRKESALVRLLDGSIVKVFPGSYSNRWLKTGGAHV